jgi:hypothetical protein
LCSKKKNLLILNFKNEKKTIVSVKKSAKKFIDETVQVETSGVGCYFSLSIPSSLSLSLACLTV